MTKSTFILDTRKQEQKGTSQSDKEHLQNPQQLAIIIIIILHDETLDVFWDDENVLYLDCGGA